MVKCRQCGWRDVQGTLFCQSCGASLEPGEPSLFRGAAATPGAEARDQRADHGSADGAAPDAAPDGMGTQPPTAQGPRAADHIAADHATSPDLFDLLEATEKAPRPPRPQRMRPTAHIARPPAPHMTPRLPITPVAPSAPPYAIPAAVELRLPNGHIFLLSGKQKYSVGRRDVDRDAPDVDFTDWNGAAAGVSRDHLGILVTPRGVYVEDHESTNDTLCNGSRLHPRQQYLLRDRDELRLGTIMLRVLFVYPPHEENAKIEEIAVAATARENH